MSARSTCVALRGFTCKKFCFLVIIVVVKQSCPNISSWSLFHDIYWDPNDGSGWWIRTCGAVWYEYFVESIKKVDLTANFLRRGGTITTPLRGSFKLSLESAGNQRRCLWSSHYMFLNNLREAKIGAVSTHRLLLDALTPCKVEGREP